MHGILLFNNLEQKGIEKKLGPKNPNFKGEGPFKDS